jgi:tetratricopeptide (TPR) repeat protein
MRSIARAARAAGSCLTLVLAARAAGAQRLGRVAFPNSGAVAAQPAFLRGALYLHSFEYDRAARAFREAQEADPGFALAYWGEALTHTHPIWNQQDLGAARAVLGRLGPTAEARRAKTPTERERRYLQAVEILYGEGSKPRRDTLYALAMEQLARDFPDDLEARAFHALALMGLSQGVRNVPTYIRAGAIADEVMRANPEHPGAAHYVIHAFDDPIHAPLGLRAARAYSGIAPDAPHAQHMTTHIFLALGMWDEVISQNTLAAGPDRARWRPGHYTSWLGYGLLQQGRHADARAHLELVAGNTGSDAGAPTRAYLLSMRAHHVVNTERWDDPLLAQPVEVNGLGPVAPAIDAFARGYAALQRGDRGAAAAALEEIGARAARPAVDDFYGGSAAVPRILGLELRSALKLAEGDGEEAVSLLREAAKLEDGMPVEFGPPDVVKPTHELLGEALLALGRAAEAQRQFERALELAPGRSGALLGLARSATAAGDRAVADRAIRDLRANWRAADRDLPALAELTRLGR